MTPMAGLVERVFERFIPLILLKYGAAMRRLKTNPLLPDYNVGPRDLKFKVNFLKKGFVPKDCLSAAR
jgi:hypothetical protein